MIDACCKHSYVVNSGVTEPNLIKFLHDVEKLLPVNLLESELQYCNLFQNASMPNEGWLFNFTLKFVAMATTLERLEKGKIPKLRSNTYHLGKKS